MDTTECYLCLQSKNICQSHIIPEFFYRELYDEKRTFIEINGSNYRFETKQQKGIREKLLCQECENQFSRYERYIAEHFYRVPDIQQMNGTCDLPLTIDYTKTRLFYLSLIWRLGIAQRPPFDTFNLGIHQEKIRSLLINENPGIYDDYGAIVAKTSISVLPNSHLISLHFGRKFGADNQEYLFFITPHITWTFIVGKEIRYKHAYLQPNGTWTIWRSDDGIADFLVRNDIPKSRQKHQVKHNSPRKKI